MPAKEPMKRMLQNCPLAPPTIALFKSNWSCGDPSLFILAPDGTDKVTGKTLDECENICRQEPLCVWIDYSPVQTWCRIAKEGCLGTPSDPGNWNAYKLTGDVIPCINCGYV